MYKLYSSLLLLTQIPPTCFEHTARPYDCESEVYISVVTDTLNMPLVHPCCHESLFVAVCFLGGCL